MSMLHRLVGGHGRGYNGKELAEEEKMAFTTISEKYYDEWYPYIGDYEIAVIDIVGPPEQVLPVSVANSILQLFVSKYKDFGETLMYIKVEADWDPTFTTDYRVTTYSRAVVQVVLVAIAAVIVTLGLLGMTWLITSATKEVVETAPLALNLGVILLFVAVAVAIYFLVKRFLAKGKEKVE